MGFSFFGLGGTNPPKINTQPGTDFNAPMSDSLKNLEGTVNGMKNPYDTGPSPLSAYVAKDFSQPLPEYDQVRNQTSMQLNAQNQSNQDAMSRRFAAMGGQNSGAYVKAAQIGDQQANETRANAMNQIGMQESQARRALQQGEATKEFQSGESTKQFNANQATQYKQLSNQFNQSLFENNSKIAQLDMAQKQAVADSQATNFNADMANWQAQRSGGLLGAGGFLGTGLG